MCFKTKCMKINKTELEVDYIALGGTKNGIIQLRRNQRKHCISRLQKDKEFFCNGIHLHACKNKDLFKEYAVRFGETPSEYLTKRIIRKLSKDESIGNVYFIGNIEYGFVKIGYSKNPEKRLSGIQVGCPFSLEILMTEEGTTKDEKAYHKEFKHLRTNGEWFKLGSDLKKFLEL